MSIHKRPKAAANRRGAKCELPSRNVDDSQPRFDCQRYFKLTIEADRRRIEIVASLLAIDPTLSAAVLMYAAGGGL